MPISSPVRWRNPPHGFRHHGQGPILLRAGDARPALDQFANRCEAVHLRAAIGRREESRTIG